METRQKVVVAALLAVLAGLSAGVQAAVVAFQDEQPTPGPYDVYNFVGADRDANNVGTYDYDTWLNNETTYIAGDRPAQGQSFKTGTSRPVYLVTGVWIRHVGYTNSSTTGSSNNGTWYFLHVGNAFGIRITDPSASGAASFVLGSETYTLTGNEPNALHPFSENYNHGNANGTGKWIHLVLDTPVVVSPGTTYGFDVISVHQTGGWGANMFFEMLGIKDDSKDPNGNPNGNPYADGKAYTSGTGGIPTNSLTWAPGDRVFMVEFSGDIPPVAYGPSPANGTWCAKDQDLGWQRGGKAVVHDVYLGTDLGKVTDANRANLLGVLKSTGQSDTTYDPGILTEGAYYYWRIDEVNGVNVWKGNVWKFLVQPTKAFDPSPTHNEICVFVDPKPALSWSAGRDSTQGKVYFGTSPTSLSLKSVVNYILGQTRYSYQTSGTINNNTDYYWRIDEKRPDGSFPKGDVWHFKTIPSVITQPDPHLVGWWKFDEGPGKAIDWSGLNQHGTVYGTTLGAGHDANGIAFDGSDDYVNLPIGPTLSSMDSMTIATWANVLGDGAFQKIFDFGFDPPAGPNSPTIYMYLTPINGSGVPRFAITTTGTGGESGLDARTALPSGWHHLAVTLDAATYVTQLYVDGAVVATGAAQTLPKDLGKTPDNYLGQSKRWENVSGVPDPHFSGSLDDFRIYNKALTQQEMAKVMSGDPLLAWNPSPANGMATDIQKASPLSWSAGDGAVQHDVYLGTDLAAVKLATPSDATGIYRSRQAATTYTPSAKLQEGQTYYWRVDEVQGDGTVSTGKVWTFSVANYLIVDDFESYDNLCNRIFFKWTDGYGSGGSTDCGVDPYGGNGTGSTVGNVSQPFAEQTIVHSGRQSMPLGYNNANNPYYSETVREWSPTQDWTAGGGNTLTVFLRGDASSFMETGAGTVVMNGTGTDIWDTSDEFRLVYKQLKGNGTIVTRVDSVALTNAWSKAGVMIRETLDATSKHAMVVVSGSSGVSFQRRIETGGSSTNTDVTGLAAPYWVKLTRNGSTFTAQCSADGVTWQDITVTPAITITMANDVYVGLAVTSHAANVACGARFSSISTSGGVSGSWQMAEVGISQISGNTPDTFYVVVQDSSGHSAMVTHPDKNVIATGDWEQWNVAVSGFSSAGVNLGSVAKITIGVGDRNAPKAGGAGKLYIDDIRVTKVANP